MTLDPEHHHSHDHVYDTVRSIAQLRADHVRSAKPLQRFVDSLTRSLSRPALIVWLTVFVGLWIAVNASAAAFGARPVDPPPFFWLEGIASLSSLYLVIFILASQRREDALAQRRELLVLELAVLSEQKTAKIIELLEEFRRDSPQILDRVDREAARMSRPADPGAVANAISESQLDDSQPSLP